MATGNNTGRWAPEGPAWAYKTYRIVTPRSHRRPASCAELDCEKWRNGWLTALDAGNPRQAKLADWIRLHSKRSFTVEQIGMAVKFVFPAGQQCFEPHSVRCKPPLYLVQGGDWRGNPRGVATVRHSGIDSWVDDFASNQQAIADRVGRG